MRRPLAVLLTAAAFSTWGGYAAFFLFACGYLAALLLRS